MFGGAPPDLIEALQSEETELDIEPENWPTVSLFMRLQTQWRVGMSGITGLDYVAVKSVMEFLGIENRAELFDGLQIMEVAVLKSLNKG